MPGRILDSDLTAKSGILETSWMQCFTAHIDEADGSDFTAALIAPLARLSGAELSQSTCLSGPRWLAPGGR